MKLFLFAIVALTLASAHAALTEEMKADMKAAELAWAKLDGIQESLIEVINADKSCSSDADCDVIAYGSRACGGPQGFAVYSTKSPYVGAIEILAHKTEAVESEMNEKHGMASICTIARPPAFSCNKNLCEETAK